MQIIQIVSMFGVGQGSFEVDAPSFVILQTVVETPSAQISKLSIALSLEYEAEM